MQTPTDLPDALSSPAVIPTPPRGGRFSLAVDPGTRTATIRWKAVGGPGITILLLIMLAPFALVSAFMSVMALTSSRSTSPLLVACVLAMTVFIWLLVVIVIEAHVAWQQVLTISPDIICGGLQGGISGRLFGSLRRWQEPTKSVRTVRVEDDDVIVLAGKGLTRRMLVHLPATDECEWMMQAISTIITEHARS